MIVLALLDPQAEAHLRRSLGATHDLVRATGPDELADHLAHKRADVVCIDPCAGRGGAVRSSEAHPAVAVLERAPLVPFVVYAGEGATAMHAMMDFVRLGAGALVVRGVDDALPELRRALEAAAASGIGRRILAELAEPVMALPAALRRAVAELFAHPERFRDVAALSDRAATTRRSVDRWLGRSGFSSARHLLSSARVTLAYQLLRVGARRLADVARSMGYPSERRLAREIAMVTGLTPSALRRQCDAGDFVVRVVGHLRRADTVRAQAASVGRHSATATTARRA